MGTATAVTVLADPIQDPTPANSPVELVARVKSWLTCPADPIERLRFATIADDLGWLDGDSVADLLDQPVDRFGGAYAQLSAYSLVVLAVAELVRHGVAPVGRERLLRTIRQQVRNELVHVPPYLSTLWLVPATAEERTAVHVGALLLSRCGEATRPWLPPSLPDHGRFLIVGSEATAPAATAHPFAAHHRCAGVTDFTHLAIHSPATC